MKEQFDYEGDAYVSLNDFDRAKEALQIAISSKDYETQAYIYNNIGAVLVYNEQCPYAHRFFKKAWKAKENFELDAVKNRSWTARMYLNNGICYCAVGKYEEARRYLEEILWKITEKELQDICLFVWELGAEIAFRK